MADKYGFLKELLVERKVYQVRLGACKNCESFQFKLRICKECGCFIMSKARAKASTCPLNKWED